MRQICRFINALNLLSSYLKKERDVTGGSGPAPGFSSNFACKIFCIRSRSEGEQRDCEIPTMSAGSGIVMSVDSSPLPDKFCFCCSCCSCRYCRQPR